MPYERFKEVSIYQCLWFASADGAPLIVSSPHTNQKDKTEFWLLNIRLPLSVLLDHFAPFDIQVIHCST